MSNPFTASKSARLTAVQNPYVFPRGAKSGSRGRHDRRRSRGVRFRQPRTRRAPRAKSATDDQVPIGSSLCSTDEESDRSSSSRVPARNQPGRSARRIARTKSRRGMQSPSMNTSPAPRAVAAPMFRMRARRTPSSSCHACTRRPPKRCFQSSTTASVELPDPSSATTISNAESDWLSSPRRTASSASGHSYVETTTVRRDVDSEAVCSIRRSIRASGGQLRATAP